MTNGTMSLGMSKHRKSGVSPKSPRLRLAIRLAAEKSREKRKPEMVKTIRELFKK